MYRKSLSAISLNLTSLGGLITLFSTLVISIPSMTNPASALSCQFSSGGCSKSHGQYGSGGFGIGGSGSIGGSGNFGGGSLAPSGPGKPSPRQNSSGNLGTSPSSPVNPPSNSSTNPQKDPSVCSRKPYLPQC